MSNEKSVTKEVVIVVATNTMKFPELQFFYHSCRNTKEYSFLFAFEEEDSVITCLEILPRGTVAFINLKTRRITLLQGLFTRIDITKKQLEDYKIQYEEIGQQINPILFEFQTLKRVELTIY
ncbi:hypothetical protein [Enterococcus rotai]|uniref:hypothetical protein n=1 Tax=Enterococcus rotai TaxID=118060 RepID=UPI0035C77B44